MKVGDKYVLCIRDTAKGSEDSFLMNKHYNAKVLEMYEHHVYLQVCIFDNEIFGFSKPKPFNVCLSYTDFMKYVINTEV